MPTAAPVIARGASRSSPPAVTAVAPAIAAAEAKPAAIQARFAAVRSAPIKALGRSPDPAVLDDGEHRAHRETGHQAEQGEELELGIPIAARATSPGRSPAAEPCRAAGRSGTPRPAHRAAQPQPATGSGPGAGPSSCLGRVSLLLALGAGRDAPTQFGTPAPPACTCEAHCSLAARTRPCSSSHTAEVHGLPDLPLRPTRPSESPVAETFKIPVSGNAVAEILSTTWAGD